MDDTKALMILIKKKKCIFISKRVKCDFCAVCDMQTKDEELEDALDYVCNLLLQKKAEGGTV